MAETLHALDIPYIALNPGASYRGLHDSIVNYLGNENPKMLLCLHEEHAIAIAQGYAKVTGKPMAAAIHSNVGLMHASMAIFNAWCDRAPMLILGATGPWDAATIGVVEVVVAFASTWGGGLEGDTCRLVRVEAVAVVVGEALAIGVAEGTAGGPQHRFRGGHVPILGGRTPGKGDVEIALAPQDRCHLAADAAHHPGFPQFQGRQQLLVQAFGARHQTRRAQPIAFAFGGELRELLGQQFFSLQTLPGWVAAVFQGCH
jgi:hypothetical protein